MGKWKFPEVSCLARGSVTTKDRANSNEDMFAATIHAINPETGQEVRPQVELPNKLHTVQVDLNFCYTTKDFLSISTSYTILFILYLEVSFNWSSLCVRFSPGNDLHLQTANRRGLDAKQQSRWSRKNQGPSVRPTRPRNKASPRQAREKSPCVSGSLVLRSSIKESKALLTDTGWLPGADTPTHRKDAWGSQTPPSNSPQRLEAILWGTPTLGDNRLLSPRCGQLLLWLCCQ